MKGSRTFITAKFLKRIRTKGSLAAAAERLLASTANYAPLPNMSTWALVCEEVVDTEYRPDHYERVVAELFRRGISRDVLDQMRVFAWETAGWLNFEKMVWDWCSLDEHDIQRAIDWQLNEGEIDVEEHSNRLAFLQRFAPRAEQATSPSGAPAAPSGNSGVNDGPTSVS
jgi:hypothetical protein